MLQETDVTSQLMRMEDLFVCHHPVIYDKGDLGWATSIAKWD